MLADHLFLLEVYLHRIAFYRIIIACEHVYLTSLGLNEILYFKRLFPSLSPSISFLTTASYIFVKK